MKKTILYLMNGFGIEQKDSYNMYNSNLMPNLEDSINNSLFGTIESNETDIYNAYRFFSTGSKDSLTYPFLTEYSEKFDINPNMKILFEQLPSEKPIHLFLVLKNSKSVEHIKNFADYIQTKNKNKIYLHILLDSKRIDDFKEFNNIITKINYSVKDVSLKTICGMNILKDTPKSYVQILNKGVGEKWRELEKKFTTLEQSNIYPEDTEPFYFDNNFEFDKDAFIFFFNYVQFNLEPLLFDFKTYNNIEQTYSMFPMKGVNYPLFSYPTSNVSLDSTIKKLNFKTHIVAEENKIGRINYYLTGLKYENSDYIGYSVLKQNLLTDDTYLNNLCNDPKFELVIINDSIENEADIQTLTNKLKSIDDTIGKLKDICINNDYTLVISSLYGIKKEIKNDNFSKFLVNFSGKVPVVVVDSVFKKNVHMISYLDLYALANTLYTNINNKHEGTVLIKKRSQLPGISKK